MQPVRSLVLACLRCFKSITFILVGVKSRMVPLQNSVSKSLQRKRQQLLACSVPLANRSKLGSPAFFSVQVAVSRSCGGFKTCRQECAAN